MDLLLTIDTATGNGSVSLSQQGKLIGERTNTNQMDHAAWIHVAMNEMYKEAGLEVKATTAVAVVAGPGSYTGLRVGMATAKGICYALHIPLVCLNTLQVMAVAAAKLQKGRDQYLCPMIDARRQEVFTAVFDSELKEVLPSCAVILEPESFAHLLNEKPVLFFGDGSAKWQNIVQHSGASFAYIYYTPGDIAKLAFEELEKDAFTDLAYADPIYVKEFYTHSK